MTGEHCPPSLATPAQYRAYGIPWLEIYNDNPLRPRTVVPMKDGKIWSTFLPEDAVAPLQGKRKATPNTDELR